MPSTIQRGMTRLRDYESVCQVSVAHASKVCYQMTSCTDFVQTLLVLCRSTWKVCHPLRQLPSTVQTLDLEGYGSRVRMHLAYLSYSYVASASCHCAVIHKACQVVVTLPLLICLGWQLPKDIYPRCSCSHMTW
jgi:hypothetical protein